MERHERFYCIDALLNHYRAVSMRDMTESLGVSRATINRDIEYMRDRLFAPIVWDHDLRGYRFDRAAPGAGRYQLPGMWFNASEAHALLTMEHLLENLQPDLLAPHIKPLRSRIRALLETGDHAAEDVMARIRVLPMGARKLDNKYFGVISSALLARKRLKITHYARNRGDHTEREVSPQRLVHYRDNWYLDTWCHLRGALRTFSVDAISGAEMLDAKAKPVAEKRLDSVLGTGYGIFAGAKTRTAVLRFSPGRARWVSRERWHPEQKCRTDGDGRYVLEFPYSDDRELVMDILKHGPDVEVLKPAALRRRVRDLLEGAAAHYS